MIDGDQNRQEKGTLREQRQHKEQKPYYKKGGESSNILRYAGRFLTEIRVGMLYKKSNSGYKST